MSQCRGRGEERELQNGGIKKREKRKGGGQDKSQKQRTSKEKWNGVKLAGTNAWSSQDFLWSYLISLSVLPLLPGQTSRMLSRQDGKTGDFRGFFYFFLSFFHLNTSPRSTHCSFLCLNKTSHTHIFSPPFFFSLSIHLFLSLSFCWPNFLVAG